MKKKFVISKKRKFMIVILGVLVVAGAMIYKSKLSESTEELTEAVAEKQDMTKYYSFSGNIESSDVQYVVSTTNEPVKKFYVKEGDIVQTGDMLYEVDSNTIESTLTTASTSVANAKTTYSSSKLDYERKQILYASGDVALVDLEAAKDAMSKAKNQITEAEALYNQAKKQNEDTKCYAEVSGEVSKIYVDENDSITQGVKILDIINYDDLEVNVKVDEYDLSVVSEGKEADVYFEALGKTVTGTISEISRGASVENGVSYFKTTVTLPQDVSLRVGLSAEVKVIAEQAVNAVTVPVQAIMYEESKPYVQRYDEKGKLENVYVTVGITNGSMIEITEGLEEGEKIVYKDTSKTNDTQSFPPAPGGLGQSEQGKRPSDSLNGLEVA
jgi:RND family efflux transporter MFP subunit